MSKEDMRSQLTQNQKNQMSEDPGDGARNSSTLGRDGPPTPVERPPEGDRQDEAAIEGRGSAGAGD